MKNNIPNNRKSDKALFGMTLILIGFALLIRSLNIFFISQWIISWPVFLILVGLIMAKRKSFKDPIAFMPLLIGLIFLPSEIYPNFDPWKLFWPAMVITYGFWLILGRKKEEQIINDAKPIIIEPIVSDPIEPAQETNNQDNTNKSSYIADRIDSTSIFGGIKKNVVSKNFQGGDILNFFGGTEINLLQADIHGIVKINVVQVFGGTKIIVPANWTVQSEMVALVGGIEDKRPPQAMANPDKILIIQGTSVFAGIDIKSY